MHGQVLQPHEDGHAEGQTKNTNEDADEQELMTIYASVKEGDRRKIGKAKIRFTTGFIGLGGKERKGSKERHGRGDRKTFYGSAAPRPNF
jgi:hypothetical protein